MGRTFDRVGWPLRTERLVIAPAVVADAHRMFGYRGREDVALWLPRRPTDAEAFAQWFPAALDQTLVIERRDGRTATLVGDLYLDVQDSWAQAEVVGAAVGTVAEIGWALDPAYVGQGYATEAATALIDVCFDRLGVRRVVATGFAANESSWRLMERLGMRREQYAVGDSLHRCGEWLDGVTYAVLATEWISRR